MNAVNFISKLVTAGCEQLVHHHLIEGQDVIDSFPHRTNLQAKILVITMAMEINTFFATLFSTA